MWARTGGSNRPTQKRSPGIIGLKWSGSDEAWVFLGSALSVYFSFLFPKAAGNKRHLFELKKGGNDVVCWPVCCPLINLVTECLIFLNHIYPPDSICPRFPNRSSTPRGFAFVLHPRMHLLKAPNAAACEPPRSDCFIIISATRPLVGSGHLRGHACMCPPLFPSSCRSSLSSGCGESHTSFRRNAFSAGFSFFSSGLWQVLQGIKGLHTTFRPALIFIDACLIYVDGLGSVCLSSY